MLAPVVLLRSLTVTVLIGLVAGCPRQTTPQPASPPPGETEQPLEAPVEPEPEPTLPPLRPGPCAEGGRLWDGKPVDCSYEHGGCCYGSAAQACTAAGCAEGSCTVLESYPAQISCG